MRRLLVLNQPHNARERDDGKLIASEINHLKLDVVWIILSTCDLVYTDGVEAENPSGLVNADILS